VIRPLLNTKAKRSERLAKIEKELETTRREVKTASRELAWNREIAKELLQISRQYILRPQLGNYLLNARDYIEDQAGRVDLAVDTIREVGITDVPRPRKSRDEPALRIYTVRMNLTAGYHPLVELIRSIERSSPYLCLSSILVTGQPTRSPDVHTVVLDLQLPIWADPELAQALRRQIESELDLELAEEGDEEIETDEPEETAQDEA